MGLQIDLLPDSPNYYNENNYADSKEIYWWDLGS